MRKSEKPKVQKADKVKGGHTETHPAYGMIGISRVTGGQKLFGSAVDTHSSYITITIKHAERDTHLSRDWHHATGQIVELSMSNAQFVEMITNPNWGDGVPCTLEWVTGEGYIPMIEGSDTESQKVIDGFGEAQKEFVDTIREQCNEIHGFLAKKGRITAAERVKIRELLSYIYREIAENRPFAVSQFREAAEKVMTHYKVEVESFMSMALSKLGLSKLEEMKKLLPK